MYNNFPQSSIYESSATDIYAQPMYSNQYDPTSYANINSMNQQSQPMYPTDPNQSLPYSMSMQQQFPSQPQYVDNTYAYQPSQPIYQTVSQQPPPSYATVMQQVSPSAPIQQQTPYIATNSSSKNQISQGSPFSHGYKWPRRSIPVTCPQCGASITTRLEKSITIVTIIGALLLFLCTCILVCLPFLVSSCKKTTHYCPNCSSVLGVRRELR